MPAKSPHEGRSMSADAACRLALDEIAADPGDAYAMVALPPTTMASPASETTCSTVVIGRFAPVVGRGLLDVLSEDHLVRVLASNLELTTLERMVTQHTVDVMIIDEPAESSTLARLRMIRPATGIIVFVHDPPAAYGVSLLAAGATCVDRSVSAADILKAVRVAARGGRIFASPHILEPERGYPPDAPPLTKREIQVLRLVSERIPYARIADALGISVETVRKHVAKIRSKLGIQSTQELFGMLVPESLEQKWSGGE
jgi:DNA-binding NarL/FixJ family response regulator